jgi:hypothetical protein
MVDYGRGGTCLWEAQPNRDDTTDVARVERAWNDEERAALVALLRTRPSKLTWSEITAQVGASYSDVGAFFCNTRRGAA